MSITIYKQKTIKRIRKKKSKNVFKKKLFFSIYFFKIMKLRPKKTESRNSGNHELCIT